MATLVSFRRPSGAAPPAPFPEPPDASDEHVAVRTGEAAIHFFGAIRSAQCLPMSAEVGNPSTPSGTRRFRHDEEHHIYEYDRARPLDARQQGP